MESVESIVLSRPRRRRSSGHVWAVSTHNRGHTVFRRIEDFNKGLIAAKKAKDGAQIAATHNDIARLDAKLNAVVERTMTVDTKALADHVAKRWAEVKPREAATIKGKAPVVEISDEIAQGGCSAALLKRRRSSRLRRRF